MLKAIFIAPSYVQAKYWAEYIWGYQHNEWRYCDRTGTTVTLHGFRGPDIKVYTCGTHEPSERVWEILEVCDFEVVDAMSIDVPGNHEIEWIPSPEELDSYRR